MNKKIGIVIAVVLLVAVVIIITQVGNYEEGEEVIRIGAILPLTGSASLLGQGVQEGLEIAIQEINESKERGNKKLVLILEDSQNDPKLAVSAFHKMMVTEKPIAVISEMSSVSKALAPLAQRENIVLFATVTAAPDLTSMNEWVFRNYYSTRTQGEALANFLASNRKTSLVGILHLTDDYGVTGKKEFVKSLSEKGITNVVIEGYAKNATDLRAQATKLKAANPDAVCVIAYDEALARAFRQLREIGYESQLCTYTGLANPKVLEQTGSAAEGAYVAMADYDPSNPKPGVQTKFISKYKQKFGQLPSHYPAFGYDTLMCLKEALNKSATDPEIFKNTLSNLASFEGVMGDIVISQKREVVFSQAIRVVKTSWRNRSPRCRKFLNIS